MSNTRGWSWSWSWSWNGGRCRRRYRCRWLSIVSIDRRTLLYRQLRHLFRGRQGLRCGRLLGWRWWPLSWRSYRWGRLLREAIRTWSEALTWWTKIAWRRSIWRKPWAWAEATWRRTISSTKLTWRRGRVEATILSRWRIVLWWKWRLAAIWRRSRRGFVRRRRTRRVLLSPMSARDFMSRLKYPKTTFSQKEGNGNLHTVLRFRHRSVIYIRNI